MREYETLYVQHPEAPESRQQEINARVRSLIQDHGGEIVSVKSWGLKELAYPIQKQKKGVYYLVRYRATPAVVNELERNLKILDEVIRFITVRIPEHVLKSQRLTGGVEHRSSREDEAVEEVTDR
ncbi:MAG: 30S ribosomal protein S6 [Candidatus Binatia bacterium]|nr:30S ribosomal protein S6 [Candidatus Binatia bacterium]